LLHDFAAATLKARSPNLRLQTPNSLKLKETSPGQKFQKCHSGTQGGATTEKTNLLRDTAVTIPLVPMILPF